MCNPTSLRQNNRFLRVTIYRDTTRVNVWDATQEIFVCYCGMGVNAQKLTDVLCVDFLITYLSVNISRLVFVTGIDLSSLSVKKDTMRWWCTYQSSFVVCSIARKEIMKLICCSAVFPGLFLCSGWI